MNDDISAYERQGFGAAMAPKAPYGLLIVDLVNGFADPAVFGGGNIPEAIARTVGLLAHARQQGWPVAHSRIVFADDDADHNIFTLKVPGMLTLKEADHNSAIVPQLAPASGELVVRKTVPSAFFGTSLAAWLSQRGADAAGRRRGHQRLRAGQRGGRHAVRLSPAGGVGLRGRPRHRPARGQSFRHAAEVRHRADAGRSPAGDAGLVGSR